MPIKMLNCLVYIKSDGVLGIATHFYGDGSADCTWYVDHVEFRAVLFVEEYVKVNNVR